MGALLIVAGDPNIEVELQHFHCVVDFFAEGDAVELIQQGFVEPLADPIGLRAFYLVRVWSMSSTAR